jgi:hypothetical protein
MHWYLAKIVYRVICGAGEHTPQFNEQLRLISATGHDEALWRSKEIGIAESEMFYNDNMQLVQWQFINVSELYRVSELLDGAELYSTINEVDNAEAYTNFVNDKARMLQQQRCSYST